MKKTIIFTTILLTIFTFFGTASNLFAQGPLSSIGVATYLPINSKVVEDGSIIISKPEGYFLSEVPYDPQIEGVISLNPGISIETEGTKTGLPVISTGTVLVRVSGENGSIKRGEFITTSNVKGVGMKADQSGYVVGQAIESTSFRNPQEIKSVPITLNIHFLTVGAPLTNSLFGIFSLSRIASFEKPSRVLQYVVAAIITLISFGIGFAIFAKVVNTGIEALGRNPLAGRMIQLSIVFNVILILLIVAAGVSLAYFVIRL